MFSFDEQTIPIGFDLTNSEVTESFNESDEDEMYEETVVDLNSSNKFQNGFDKFNETNSNEKNNFEEITEPKKKLIFESSSIFEVIQKKEEILESSKYYRAIIQIYQDNFQKSDKKYVMLQYQKQLIHLVECIHLNESHIVPRLMEWSKLYSSPDNVEEFRNLLEKEDVENEKYWNFLFHLILQGRSKEVSTLLESYFKNVPEDKIEIYSIVQQLLLSKPFLLNNSDYNDYYKNNKDWKNDLSKVIELFEDENDENILKILKILNGNDKIIIDLISKLKLNWLDLLISKLIHQTNNYSMNNFLDLIEECLQDMNKNQNLDNFDLIYLSIFYIEKLNISMKIINELFENDIWFNLHFIDLIYNSKMCEFDYEINNKTYNQGKGQMSNVSSGFRALGQRMSYDYGLGTNQQQEEEDEYQIEDLKQIRNDLILIYSNNYLKYFNLSLSYLSHFESEENEKKEILIKFIKNKIKIESEFQLIKILNFCEKNELNELKLELHFDWSKIKFKKQEYSNSILHLLKSKKEKEIPKILNYLFKNLNEKEIELILNDLNILFEQNQNSKFLFISKYLDLLNSLKQLNFEMSSNLIIQLLQPSFSPKSIWLKILFQSLKLLNQKENYFNEKQTYFLLNCLDDLMNDDDFENEFKMDLQILSSSLIRNLSANF
eukprot:gene2653-3850_t